MEILINFIVMPFFLRESTSLQNVLFQAVLLHEY